MMLLALAAVVTVLGSGGDACSVWNREHDARTAKATQEDQWVLGYVSGSDQMRVSMIKLNGRDVPPAQLDAGAVLREVDKGCRQTPALDLNVVASLALMNVVTENFMNDLRTPH